MVQFTHLREEDLVFKDRPLNALWSSNYSSGYKNVLVSLLSPDPCL